VQDRASGSRAAAVAGIALGLSVAGLALLGPLAGDVVRYRVGPSLRAQLIGSDLVSLGVTAPLVVLAAVLSRRRSPVGPLLALGPAVACWRLLAALLVGQDRSGRYGGNDEALLPVFLGMLLLASGVAVAAWRAVPRRRVVFDRPTGVLVAGLLLAACLFDVAGRYLPAWLALVAGRATADYTSGPAFWWALAVEDLAALLPAAAVTGVGLLRRARWAGPPAFAVSGALALGALATIGRWLATALHGDDGFTLGTGLWTVAWGLVSLAPAAVCWLAVVRTGERAWREVAVPAPAIPGPRASDRERAGPVLPTARPPLDDAVSRFDPVRH
jgi:hypothetical protein